MLQTIGSGRSSTPRQSVTFYIESAPNVTNIITLSSSTDLYGVAPGLPAGCAVVLIEDLFHLLLITNLCLFKLHSTVSSSSDCCLTCVEQHRPNHCFSLICIPKLFFCTTFSFLRKSSLNCSKPPDHAESVSAAAPPPLLPQSQVKSVLEGLLSYY